MVVCVVKMDDTPMTSNSAMAAAIRCGGMPHQIRPLDSIIVLKKVSSSRSSGPPTDTSRIESPRSPRGVALLRRREG